jgi:hypothetical protein
MNRNLPIIRLAIVLAALIPLSTAMAQTTPVTLSVDLTDGALNSITNVDPGNNDPALDGADFLVNVSSWDTENLGTYSQKIGYDSTLVAFRSGVAAGGMPSAGGRNPGILAINDTHAWDGPDSYVIVTSIGIANQDGREAMARLGFDVLASSGSGLVTIDDNTMTTAAYADIVPLDISHNSPGVPGFYTILQDETAVRHWELFR